MRFPPPSSLFRPLRAGLLVGMVAATPAIVHAATCGNALRELGEACDDGNLVSGDCCSATCTAESDEAPCDDGKPCTAEDVCRRGACVGVPGDGLCALDLNPLACFTAKRDRHGAPSFVARTENVLDEFTTDPPEQAQPFDLTRAAVVCSAAAAAPSELAGGQHAEGYQVRVRSRGRRARSAPVEVESALGPVTLQLKRVKRLLVTAGLARGDGGADEPATTARFACYRAAIARTTRGRRGFTPATITLADVRGGPYTYRIGKPVALCVPEVVVPFGDGGAPKAHIGYLTCHRAKPARGQPGDAGAGLGVVSTATPFGAELLRGGKLTEVCVPTVAARPPTIDPDAPAFPFLAETDPVATAMGVVFTHAANASTSAAQAIAAGEETAAATAVIREHLAEAQAKLLVALQTLEPDDDGGYAALAALVRVAGDSPAVLTHLHDLLMRTPGIEREAHVLPPDELVRHQALRSLVHHAGLGNAMASEGVLTAVRSPDHRIASAAVGYVYRLGTDRRAAQRALRALLPPERRYLLYVR